MQHRYERDRLIYRLRQAQRHRNRKEAQKSYDTRVYCRRKKSYREGEGYVQGESSKQENHFVSCLPHGVVLGKIVCKKFYVLP